MSPVRPRNTRQHFGEMYIGPLPCNLLLRTNIKKKNVIYLASVKAFLSQHSVAVLEIQKFEVLRLES